MQITASGWKRDCGANTIADSEIDDKVVRVSTGGFKPHKTYVKQRANGDIEVRVGPNTLTLGGTYQVGIRLSKAEVDRLFVMAHQGDDAGDVFETIGGLFEQMKEAKAKALAAEEDHL